MVSVYRQKNPGNVEESFLKNGWGMKTEPSFGEYKTFLQHIYTTVTQMHSIALLQAKLGTARKKVGLKMAPVPYAASTTCTQSAMEDKRVFLVSTLQGRIQKDERMEENQVSQENWWMH